MDQLNSMRMLKTLLVSIALVLSSSLFAQEKAAEDEPNISYVTQTTSRIVIPDDGSEKEMQKLYQEFFDKIVAKSKYVKGYTLSRHAWGSEGATLTVALEFASWADIDMYNGTEIEALAKAAWPDEAAREAFFEKFGSYTNPYHKDEIMVVMNGMRKYATK